MINKKLTAGGIRITGARHRNRAAQVVQSVSTFIYDGVKRRFFDQIRGVAAPLNHKVADHSVENGVVVMTRVNVAQKICDGNGRFIRIQFEADIAAVCSENDDGVDNRA